MRFAVFGLLIVIGIMISYVFDFNPHTKKIIPCSRCYQDVSTATYLAFITLDCDGDYESYSTCADDLENVNVAPTLNSVSVDSKGNVTVKLTITEKSGLKDNFVFRFNKLGSLLT